MSEFSAKKIVVPEENAFNFLRLVCCLIVIYEHSVVLSQSEKICLDFRGIAVNVFFILSGFWVTVSFLKSSSAKEFALKRCRKIFPQYFAVIIFSAIFLCTFSSLKISEYFFNADFFKYILANFSTLNFLHPSLPGVFENQVLNGSVNGSLWTIKIEIAFYVFLPVFICAVRLFGGGGIQQIPSSALRRIGFVRGFYAVCNR
jgi:peptidoglycan/LPS O-acetylase OafA/YrhL